MRYYVTLGPEEPSPTVVDVTEGSDGRLTVLVDRAPVEVDVAALGDRFDVRIGAGARVVDLIVEASPEGHAAFVTGRHAPLLVESERSRGADRERDSAGAQGKGAIVRSPMPGRVVRVLVVAGQTVETGQGIAVLEAMKMENEVRARAPGEVLEVHVAPGAAVEANAKLVTLGPPSRETTAARKK